MYLKVYSQAESSLLKQIKSNFWYALLSTAKFVSKFALPFGCSENLNKINSKFILEKSGDGQTCKKSCYIFLEDELFDGKFAKEHKK